MTGVLACGSLQAQQPAAGQPTAVPPWRVYATLASGQNTYCAEGSNLWVFEEDGTFSLHRRKERSGNYAAFTLPQAADGSVHAEKKNPLNNRMIRLVVPAGFGPREFDAVDLYHGCRHHFRPW